MADPTILIHSFPEQENEQRHTRARARHTLLHHREGRPRDTMTRVTRHTRVTCHTRVTHVTHTWRVLQYGRPGIRQHEAGCAAVDDGLGVRRYSAVARVGP